MVDYEDTPRGKLTQVGGWTLGKTLGRGAYAHVRHAVHFTGAVAACKILPCLRAVPGRAPSWDQVVDALEAHKEVVLLKALNGGGVRGIVGLEGVIEEEGWTYVFLSLYPYSLSSLKPMSDTNLVPLLRHLLHTVNALHKLSISHEDIKRANIMVDKQLKPVLVDFGFSLFWPDRSEVKSVGGTLDYSSPEKAADAWYDPKANDVWSLGITVCRLAGWPNPYLGIDYAKSHTESMKLVIDGEPNWMWDPLTVPQGSKEDLIMCMLERDPVARWTIPQLLLHPYLTHFPPSDPPAYRPPPLEGPPMWPVSEGVLQNLCFLAMAAGQMTLCETSSLIKRNLSGTRPCWEKRWARMLEQRELQEEMAWVDEATGKKAVRTGKIIARQSRVLRPILLTPIRGTATAAIDHAPHLFAERIAPKPPGPKVSARGIENEVPPATPAVLAPKPRRKPMQTKRDSLLHPPPDLVPVMSSNKGTGKTMKVGSGLAKRRLTATITASHVPSKVATTQTKTKAQLRTVAVPAVAPTRSGVVKQKATAPATLVQAVAKHPRGIKKSDDLDLNLNAIHDQLEAAALRLPRTYTTLSGSSTVAAASSATSSDVVYLKMEEAEKSNAPEVTAAGKTRKKTEQETTLAPPPVQQRRRSPRLNA
ncbi:hypothetical protein Q5752_005634 [Cryptotrichosporon argae]